MVRLRIRVNGGYDVILNMSTAVSIKLQTVVWKCSPTCSSAVQILSLLRHLYVKIDSEFDNLILNIIIARTAQNNNLTRANVFLHKATAAIKARNVYFRQKGTSLNSQFAILIDKG